LLGFTFNWIIIAMIIMFLACYLFIYLFIFFGNSSSNSKWFLKQPWHIMATFQDDKVKIRQTRTLKEWLGGAWLIIFTH